MLFPIRSRSGSGGGGVSTEAAVALPENERWENFAVEHLQLAPRANDGLRARGITTIRQALNFPSSNESAEFPYASDLFEAIRHVRMAEGPNGVDWRHYWQLRENRFHQLAASLREFDQLAEALADYAVDRRSLGNAGAMLQASGVRTFPQLVAGLRRGLGSVRGIGRTKIAELFDRLSELTERLESGRLPPFNRLTGIGGAVTDATADVPGQSAEMSRIPTRQLPDEVRRLPLSMLQLGPKSRWLQHAGIESIGDLADLGPTALRRIPVIGPWTVKSIERKLEELARSSAKGHIDWRMFSEHSGLPLIPIEPLTSASEMLARLPEIIEAIGPHLKDDSYRAILLQRLTKGPGIQLTLEALARRASPPVTRERIRQKEKKLLGQLAGALVWDADGRLGIQFHPTMLEFWHKAANEFEGEDEIRFDQFIIRLSAVWRVEREALIRELPFIVAVVTGDPQLPASFRAGSRVDPVLFGLSSCTSAVPLGSLRMGRLGVRLQTRGISTLGALVRAAADGLTNADISSVLTRVAASIGPDGSLDWGRYARDARLTAHPETAPQDAGEFVAGFCSAVCTLLSRLHSSDRRPTIFTLRTSRPVRSRPTLDAVSKILCTHGPTVKQEESRLLEELYDILIDRDFSAVPVWLDADWLRYVREAQVVFVHSGRDYAVFLSRLAETWQLSLEAAEQAGPALWAVLTGYPEGRARRKAASTRASDIIAVEPARIRLRGFRRLH